MPLGDDLVDHGGEPSGRHRCASEDRLGKMGIDGLHLVGVGDQFGALQRDEESSLVDASTGQGVTGERQPVAQCVTGGDEFSGLGGGGDGERGADLGDGLFESVRAELGVRVFARSRPGGELVEGLEGIELSAVYLGAALGVVHLALIVNEAGNSHHSVSSRRGETGAMIQDLGQFGGREFGIGTQGGLDRVFCDTCRIRGFGFCPPRHDTMILEHVFESRGVGSS